MRTNPGTALFLRLWLFLFLLFGLPATIHAHCDGLDGPVVAAAQRALESGNVNLVLIWVQKEDEPEIRTAFQTALAVHKGNDQVKALADRYFFETLVRVHRAGEGASYTGLKPAGRDLGPAIPAADQALKDGKLQPLAQLLAQTIEAGLHGRFAEAIASRSYSADDVEAGRAHIESYVQYIHYVERLYEAARSASFGHYREPASHDH